MKNKHLRYLGIIFITIGILIIIYPFYTNFVLVRREEKILSLWEEELNSPKNQEELKLDYSDNRFEEELRLQKETKLVDPTKKIPFRIMISKIDLEWIVNEGTDYKTLKKGPGHYKGSALPGEVGTCVVAGHRTTYGAPFNRLDELKKGDEILIQTMGNEDFIYIVTGKKEVSPQDTSVLANTDYPSLILSTCTPKYFATRRLIIFAKLSDWVEKEE